MQESETEVLAQLRCTCTPHAVTNPDTIHIETTTKKLPISLLRVSITKNAPLNLFRVNAFESAVVLSSKSRLGSDFSMLTMAEVTYVRTWIQTLF